MGRDQVEAALDQQADAWKSGDQDALQQANEQLAEAVHSLEGE